MFGLAAKSPAAYDHIRYEEKNHTDFLILPSHRRLRDYRNYIRPQRGFNCELISELREDRVRNFAKQERYVVLLMDEMKIQEDLVCDKHTGELIGYVDLGDPDLSYATLKKPDEVASHILVFLLRSIVNPLNFTLANFATSNVKAIQLFPLFWKAEGIVEDNCNLQVVAVRSDGASSNRTMYRMQFNDSVVYRTTNRFAFEKRFIYFICEPLLIINTARNNVAHSGFGEICSRLLWDDGCYITWQHISDLMLEDLECGLKLCPKITTDHIKLTPFSVMNVRLAAQVLSFSVSSALEKFGLALLNIVTCLTAFFDCFNIRDKRGIKPFLKQYETIDDERFSWLMNSFLPYLDSWKYSNYQGMIHGQMGNFHPLKNLKCTFHGRLMKLCELLHFQQSMSLNISYQMVCHMY